MSILDFSWASHHSGKYTVDVFHNISVHIQCDQVVNKNGDQPAGGFLQLIAKKLPHINIVPILTIRESASIHSIPWGENGALYSNVLSSEISFQASICITSTFWFCAWCVHMWWALALLVYIFAETRNPARQKTRGFLFSLFFVKRKKIAFKLIPSFFAKGQW